MKDEILKIKNLSFSYKNGNQVLCDISFSVKKGEFILLAGSSGSGKTTLLKLLKPLISPVGNIKGDILFENKDLFTLPELSQAEKIGYVGQNPQNNIVCDEVWHELAFGLENLGCDSNTIRSRVAEISAFFGIEDWFLKKTSDLSGGQKQLLSLASVMVMQPDILMLDEPTSQLDPISAQEFVSVVSRINKELGITVILSEHRLEEVFGVSDRVFILEDGKIISDLTPKETAFNLKKLNSKMYLALPSEVLCFTEIENEGGCPVNIKEGREWFFNKDIVAEIKEEADCGNCEKSFDIAISAKDIFFRYEKASKDVLNGFSLTVPKGIFYAILGSNGSGKTTALNALCKIIKVQEGSFKINGRIAYLPQDPEIILEHNTVYEDLESVVFEGNGVDRVSNIASLCRINDILSSHPYDISGGEQQRVALAKILIKSPDIILLDEPTKGLDAHFKTILGEIINKLKADGKTVVCVSHDVEFCAEYADRCALFFDGKIITENENRAFFKEKIFYKTSAGRIAEGKCENIVTKNDIIYVLTGKKKEPKKESFEQNEDINTNLNFLKGSAQYQKKENKKSKKIPAKNVILSILMLVVFIFTTLTFKDRYEMYDIRNTIFQGGSLIELFFVFYFLLPKGRKNSTENDNLKKEHKKASPKSCISALVCLAAVVATVFSGIYLFDNNKYYFISLAVIFEIFLFFMYSYGKENNKTKELVILSVICAIGVMGRIVFAPFAQFKPVCAIVIIAGSCFGSGGGFLAGAVIAFVSNMYFSQGPWTPWQMLAFGVIGFASGFFINKLKIKSRLAISLYGFLATVLIYGGITNPSSVLIYEKNPTPSMLLSTYLPGLPLDIVHGISTFFFLWFLYHPMKEKIVRIKKKYIS